MSDLKVLYGLPSEVKFCKKCVISNQRPSSTVEFKNEKGEKKKVINFNEEGICAACLAHDHRLEIDWKEREKEFLEIIKKYKTKDYYDCVVPVSGGKDSTYQAIKVRNLGLKPFLAAVQLHQLSF